MSRPSHILWTDKHHFLSCPVLLQDVVSKSKEVKGKAHYRPLCNLRVYLGANFTVVRPSYLRNHHQGQDQFNMLLYRLIWSLLLPFPLRPPPCCCTTPQIQSKLLDATVLDFLNTLFCHFWARFLLLFLCQILSPLWKEFDIS